MEAERQMVIMIVGDSVIRGKFDEVVCLHLDDVGEQVSTLERQVFNDEVERVVGVLYTWDRNISDLMENNE